MRSELEWSEKLAKIKVQLHEVEHFPCGEVKVVPVKGEEIGAFQGWQVEPVGNSGNYEEKIRQAGDELVLDFGEHLVGYLELKIEPVGPVDAPTRLKFMFAEVPSELGEDLEHYSRPKQGFGISRSWIQDEVVTVEVVPGVVKLGRRYAFRYVRIGVVDTSCGYQVKISGVRVRRVSSGDMKQVPELEGKVSEVVEKLDKVSINTLRNCMQTVFEDGPKRDRRLWLGDLRLEALANYETFANYDLVRRCLYLFGGNRRADKLVTACVYERPVPHAGDCSIMDYAALLGPTVLDYLEASGDVETAEDLWPVVKDQLRLLEYVSGDGVFQDPGNWWLFVDWQAKLHKQAALQAILIYMMNQTLKLGEKLGRSQEVGNLPGQVQKMVAAAKREMWDAGSGVFVSGAEKQVSYASQAWMILAGVVKGEEAGAIWGKLAGMKDVVLPAGPYLWHHVLEAMVASGRGELARGKMEEYWGAMLKLGATSFWEVFDPKDHKLTPYSSYLTNSYCHAWSCTPSYFIRKYPEIFQK